MACCSSARRSSPSSSVVLTDPIGLAVEEGLERSSRPAKEAVRCRSISSKVAARMEVRG